MKYRSLFIAVIITCSTVVGASLATRVHSDLGSQASLQLPNSQLPNSPSPSERFPSANTGASTVVSGETVAANPTENQPENRVTDADRNFPHQRIKLRDVVRWGSEFYHFRERVRQAVRERDASFIKTLIPQSGIPFGFGRSQSLEQLNLDNPNADFWQILEKAIAQGCNQNNSAEATPQSAAQVWQCPNVMDAFYQQYPQLAAELGVQDDMSRVIVVGEGVNVRARPTTESQVIAVLSNEIVQLDQGTWNQMLAQIPAQAIDPLDTVNSPQLNSPQLNSSGWIPVLLPNQQRGYIAKRYTYSPLESRVIFGQVNGKWQVLSVPGGD